MSIFYETATTSYLITLNWLYQALLLVFVCDTCLKMFAYGITRYFGTTWRRIEFCVSFVSLIDLILDFQYNWFRLYLSSKESDAHFIYLRLFFIQRDIRILLII